MPPPTESPLPRSHWLPRTRDGRMAVITFLALFALTQPPIVFVVANRIEPVLLGMPFLFVYLLIVYVAMIAVLIVAQRKGV